MSFLSPLFLLGGLAVAIPIVLHLLKREPEALVRFSAVRLLRSAPVEHAQKRHLRELLLLALRVAALLLLAFAFARPFFSSGASAASADVTVVMLDVSASLSAPGRFERAQTLAKDAIDDAGRGLVAVMTFADTPQTVSAPSGDRALAIAAVDAARAGGGATNYRSALNAAADVMDNRGGTMVVITDLQAAGWSPGDVATIAESTRLEIRDVGDLSPNLAVTAVRRAGDRLVATLRNTGSDARDAHAVLTVGQEGSDVRAGARAGETRVPLPADRAADVSFPVPRGQWAAVAVDDATGAAADNVRYIVLEGQSRPTVLLITATGDLSREAFYLEQALLAEGNDGRAYEVTSVAGSDLQTWNQSRIAGHAAVVLLSTRGLEHHARGLLAEYAKGGGGLLVAVNAEIDAEVLPEALGGARITVVTPAAGSTVGSPRTLASTDVRHPVLQPFEGRSSLGLVKFRNWTTIRAPECHPLARFTSGELALADCELGRGRAIVLASDLNNRWNDFPLHATFVPFVHEAIRYLAGAGRSSEYLVGSVPAGVPPVPGIAPVAGTAGAASRMVAVNIDPKESDPQRMTAEEFQTGVQRQPVALNPQAAGARDEEERQHIWQYVLAVMMAMMMVESLVAMRTT